MIIGNGLMASACREIDNDDVVFFASGVSDSKETDSREFGRERRLLEKTISIYKDKIIVYFGTTSIDDSPYVRHKQQMCDIVAIAPRHIILKLSQTVGRGGNKNNLFNYLKRTIKKGDEIRIYTEAERALIDVDHIVFVLQRLIERRAFGIHNFSYIEKMKVIDIVRIMGEEMGVTPIIKLIPGESRPSGNTEIIDVFKKNDYIRNVIKKYV